jgi:uncharacterized repeat protein (TIGR01451 family)
MKRLFLLGLSLSVGMLLYSFSHSTAVQSAALGSPAHERPTSSTPVPELVTSGPVPIGPVTTLPAGYTVTHGDGSLVGKPGGLDLVFSNLNVDQYTTLYWGPTTSTSIMHSLQGPYTPDRVLVFDPASSTFADGIGIWNGSSPNIYSSSNVATRFSLHTSLTPGGVNIPLISASGLNIAGTNVVMAVPGDFNANLLFETFLNGQFNPSNTLFDSTPMKDPSLGGTILSSFDGAFWYTAPDTAVQLGAGSSLTCLNSSINISVTIANNGPGQVTDVVVKDLLPAGLVFESFSAPPCDVSTCYDAVTGLWTVGTLPEGQQRTLILTAEVVNAGLLVNAATRTQHQVDPVPGNDWMTQNLTAVSCTFVYLPVIRR